MGDGRFSYIIMFLDCFGLLLGSEWWVSNIE